MNNCFDEFQYRNGRIVCSGWAVPEQPGKPLKIEVRDESGNPVEVDLVRVPRADVGAAMFQDKTMDMYGFSMHIPYMPEQKQVICFEVDNEQKESVTVEFSPKEMYRKYKREKSFPLVCKRYLKSKDKKNFWQQERFRNYEKKDREYAIWREAHIPDRKKLQWQKNQVLYEQPLISLVMPVYRPKPEQLKEAIASVQAQTYGKWELCIACADTKTSEVGAYLDNLVNSRRNVKVKFLEKNEGIAQNTNQALSLAAGEWIAFLDQDDLLRADALFEYVYAIHMNLADVLYCDEDKLDDMSGIFFEPHFKPDFNPDLLRCNNYICHMLMVRASLVNEVGGLDSTMEGAQDHDFVLRCMEHTNRFVHIPKVLYSWRCHRESTAQNPESKLYAYTAGKRAIEAHYRRCGIHAEIEPMKQHGWYRAEFQLEQKPLVSIIIPNMDHGDDLKRCIYSILERASYQNYEILIVENNSKMAETEECYKKLTEVDQRIKILRWEHEFNYSAINNFAAAQAKGEYLLLLNNDTELISEHAIENMLGYCMRRDVGVVGAKLYYGDDTIQHAGVLVGVSDGADHVFLRYQREEPGYMGRAIVSQNMSAVTAACMMVKKAVYEQVQGLEETFVVAYNDVDFCLKVRQAGYLVVFDAFAEWYHYESLSRGYEDTENKKKRFEEEKALLRKRWPEQMLGDPYYNKNLSLEHGYYSI